MRVKVNCSEKTCRVTNTGGSNKGAVSQMICWKGASSFEPNEPLPPPLDPPLVLLVHPCLKWLKYLCRQNFPPNFYIWRVSKPMFKCNLFHLRIWHHVADECCKLLVRNVSWERDPLCVKCQVLECTCILPAESSCVWIVLFRSLMYSISLYSTCTSFWTIHIKLLM